MSPPSVWHHARQTLGRAVRETGQALDRLAVRVEAIATTRHDFFDDPVRYQDHLSRHRQQLALLTAGRPLVSSSVAYLAPCSTLIGSVTVGPGASIWYGAILRADEGANVESFQYATYEDYIEAAEAALSVAEESQVESTDNKESSPDDSSLLLLRLESNRFRERFGRHGGSIAVGADSNIQDGCIITARVNHCRIGRGVTVGHLAQIHSATVGDFSLIGMGSVIQPGAVVETEALVAAGAVVSANTTVGAGELWVGNPARKIRDLSPQERQKLHYQSSEYVKVATSHSGVQELGGNLVNPDDMYEVVRLQASWISTDDGPARSITLDDIHEPVSLYQELTELPPPPPQQHEQLPTPEPQQQQLPIAAPEKEQVQEQEIEPRKVSRR